MSRILIIEDHNHVSHTIGDNLAASGLPLDYAAGNADALKRLRITSYGIVITSGDTAIEESLALLEEMRAVRPALKCIVLAHHSTPEKVIAALRARVFACFTPPFDTHEISNLARQAASDSQIGEDIEILSARPGWVSVRVNSRLITAERLLSFAKELSAQLPDEAKHDILQALREILLTPWSTVPPSTPTSPSKSPPSALTARWSSVSATLAPASARNLSATPPSPAPPKTPWPISLSAKKKACAPEATASSSPRAQSTS